MAAPDDHVASVEALPDGRVVAFGRHANDFLLARCTASGRPDPTAARRRRQRHRGRRIITTLAAGGPLEAEGMVVQDNG